MTILYAVLVLSPLSIQTMPGLEEACKTGKQVIEIQSFGSSCFTVNTGGFDPYIGNSISRLSFRPVKCREIVTPEKSWTEEKHEPEKREWVAE